MVSDLYRQDKRVVVSFAILDLQLQVNPAGIADSLFSREPDGLLEKGDLGCKFDFGLIMLGRFDVVAKEKAEALALEICGSQRDSSRLLRHERVFGHGELVFRSLLQLQLAKVSLLNNLPVVRQDH